jgi:hypothetical protein
MADWIEGRYRPNLPAILIRIRKIIRHEKRLVRGSAEFNRFVRRDMFVPSMGLTLRAARYGPAIRLSKFDPVEFVEPGGFVHALPSIRYEKSPTRGLFSYLAERVGFEPTVGVNPRQFSRLLP